MKTHLRFALTLLLAATVLLSACQPGAATATPTEALPTAAPTATPEPGPTLEPTATNAPSDTPEPSPTAILLPEPRPIEGKVDPSNAFFLPSGEPDTLDPARWLGGAGGIVGDLFSGLVRLDTNLQLVADLAEGWEVSPDGLTYTFHLRRNVTFHNGRPFTAADVKFSWERAANPATESHTAGTYLNDIVGVQEVLAGEATEIRGLRVVDDYTIEVTLDAPKAFFLYKLAYPTSWIVDRETVDEIDDNPVGTGPFRLMQHIQDEIYVLGRNVNYHLGPVYLEYVVYVVYPGSTTRAYEAGDIDLLRLDEDQLGRANNPSDPLFGKVTSAPSLCTTMVYLDSSVPPFDDRDVRRAFALATDREAISQSFTEGRNAPSSGLLPPGMPGYSPDTQGLDYDPLAAVESLANSSYGGPEGLPEIVLTTFGAGSNLNALDSWLIQRWQEVLGVRVRVEQLGNNDYWNEVLSGNHGQIVRNGWCADYPDPENFTDVLFRSGGPQNVGNYHNPEVEALMDQALIEIDINQRLALYARINQMLADDAAAIFLVYGSTTYTVVKPRVQGYIATPIDVVQNLYLTIEGAP